MHGGQQQRVARTAALLEQCYRPGGALLVQETLKRKCCWRRACPRRAAMMRGKGGCIVAGMQKPNGTVCGQAGRHASTHLRCKEERSQA